MLMDFVEVPVTTYQKAVAFLDSCRSQLDLGKLEVGLEVRDIVFADGESLDLDLLNSFRVMDMDNMHPLCGKTCSSVPVRRSCCTDMP